MYIVIMLATRQGTAYITTMRAIALLLVIGALGYLYITQVADQTAILQTLQLQNLYTHAQADSAYISSGGQ